jgi:site-specific DNA recombinase
MRALLYARYSTALQSALSIDDQLRVCADLVAREGWTIAGEHCDRAISGAVRERPGLNALLEALDRGAGDVVVAESLDRLSRDQEDIAAIFKRVRYNGARIWTLSEGEVGEIHIGLRGTMAAMVRKDTADKVKRGLTGRALAGMNPGGMAYGYRKIPKFDERGEQIRGLREIDPDQAEVIRRIFDDYIAGFSVRAIAERLNREGIRSPSGGLWRISSIYGDGKRRNGILQNDLYRGRLIYNRTKRIYHPVTRLREIRLNPPEDWISVDAPELRIVSEEQWFGAERIRARFSQKQKSPAKRAKRLLSGKAVCGVCGGSWIIVSPDRWGCGRRHDGRGCSNGRTITTSAFERRVLIGLEQRMLDPELVSIYVEEYRRTWAEKEKRERKSRGQLERRKADAERRIRRLMESYADGRLELDTVGDMVAEAKLERDKAARALEDLEAEKVIVLHPGLAEQYRRRIAELREAVDLDDSAAVREAIRALIDRITVTPAEGRGVALEIQGILSTILAFASGADVECMVSTVPLDRLGRNHTFLRAVA